MMHDTITYSHLDIIRSARDAAQRLGLAPENNFDTLESYWRDPAPFDAAEAERKSEVHRQIDQGMAALNAMQAARWAAEEQSSC